MRPGSLAVVVLTGLLALALPGPFASPAAAAHGGVLEVGWLDLPTTVDAAVAAGEYADNATDPVTGIVVHVQYSGSVMGMALEVPGRGWVAVALGAVLVGSNYTDVLSFVLENGTLRALDQVDHGWERHLDEAIGGTDDVIQAAAVLTASGLLVEFQVPLDSADDNDHHFRENGTYPFSLAYNATSPDLASPDTAHSSGLLVRIGPAPEVVIAAPTSIRAASARLVVGQRMTLGAFLLDPAGAPVPGQPIEFYQETTFGLLYLGLERTNALGKAGLEYEPRAEGTWTFRFMFRGTGTLLPSSQSLTIVAESAGSLPPAFRIDLGIALVVLTVLSGVWGSYAFVLRQLAAIRAEGVPRMPRLRSLQGEGGDEHRRVE